MCIRDSKDTRLASESNHSRQTLPASASALSRLHRPCSCRMLGGQVLPREAAQPDRDSAQNQTHHVRGRCW